MTDPNRPHERVVVEPERHTTVNVQPERRSGGGMAFLVGGLLVVVAIIAFVLFSGGGNPVQDAADTNVDVDVNLPSLPDAPRMPDIEPPTLPTPAPAPAN